MNPNFRSHVQEARCHLLDQEWFFFLFQTSQKIQINMKCSWLLMTSKNNSPEGFVYSNFHFISRIAGGHGTNKHKCWCLLRISYIWLENFCWSSLLKFDKLFMLASAMSESSIEITGSRNNCGIIWNGDV